MSSEAAKSDALLNEDDEMDDPEMNKLRDIIRNLEKTQTLLSTATAVPSSAVKPAENTSLQDQTTAAKPAVESSNVSPQRKVSTNATTVTQQNGVARQGSTARNSKQTSRKGSRGGSPSRDHTVPHRSASRTSQFSEDDDDFEFEENEAAMNADDESWLLSRGKPDAATDTQKPNSAESEPPGEKLDNTSVVSVAKQLSSETATVPSITDQLDSLLANKSEEEFTSKPGYNPPVVANEPAQPTPVNQTAETGMAELLRLAQAQEAEMRREVFQPRMNAPSASTNDLDLKNVADRAYPNGSGTNLSSAAQAGGSSTSLQPSGSYQQLPRGSVSSLASARQQQGSTSGTNLLVPNGSAQRARSGVSSAQPHPRSHSASRGSASDLSAELRTVIDPAQIFDAEEKLELQKAQSSSVLHKAGVSLAPGRRAVAAPSAANRNASLLGRATSGRPGSTTGTRAGSQPPVTRLSLSRADQAVMPSEKIDLANYNEVAASAPSIPGATVLSGSPYTLATTQRRGITASASRVLQTGKTGVQPVGLVKAVGATGRPAVRPVGTTPMQRSSSQPLRSGAQPAARRPSGQLGNTPLTTRSTTSGSLSARSTGTVPRSSSAAPLSQGSRSTVPRTVSATFTQRSTTIRTVTPLSARNAPTPITRGRPGTAPVPSMRPAPRPTVPRTTAPIARGGAVRPTTSRGMTPLTKPGSAPIRQPLPPGYSSGRPVTTRTTTTVSVQRMPIPLGVMQRGRGAVPIGTVTRTGVAPVVRGPLPRGAVLTTSVRVSVAPGSVATRAAVTGRVGVGAPRAGVPLTQRALEEHVLKMEIVGEPTQVPAGLLMVSNTQVALMPSAANAPRQPKVEDDSWKEGCF